MTRSPDFCGESIRNAILELLGNALRRYTPVDLERAVSRRHGVCRKDVRRAIKELVLENRLAYTQELGRTLLEISWNRPVPVGQGVILAPPEAACDVRPGEVLVRVAPGAAFGVGDHPTTRICLVLAAWVIRHGRLPVAPSAARALDLGTGSGVLAIAACLLGVAEAAGIDNDPCARTEAAQNARLNGLQDRVKILGAELDPQTSLPVRPGFSLILANLRYPTLARLGSRIRDLCAEGGILVFSGFRPHELAGLLEAYAENRFDRLRTLTNNGWSGIVMRKKAG